jgi:hypothetical protein
LENYYDSKIYKETEKIFDEMNSRLNNNNLIEFERNMMINYSGIWIGNIYNIIRNNYFEQAKKIKWLFFPYEINERNEKFYLIQKLNKVLDLDKIINSNCINYNDLNEEDQIIFRNNFKNLVNNISLNIPIITNSIDLDFEIIKYLLIFMVNNYSEKNNLPSNKKFNLNNDDEENDDDFGQNDLITINRITNEDIIIYLNQLNINSRPYVWNYLKESMKSLINSSYGKFLIKKNKIVNTFYYEPFNSKFKKYLLKPSKLTTTSSSASL